MAIAMLFSSFGAFAHNHVSKEKEMRLKPSTHTPLGMEYKASKKSTFGISITKVYENSAAQKLGLKENDVLLGINQSIVFAEKLDAILKEVETGNDITFRIQRNGANEFVSAKMPALYKTSSKGAFLGVECETVNSSIIGAKVSHILNGSSAQYANLRKGDIILGLDNKVVVANNLEDVLSGYNAGEEVMLRIQRGNEVFVAKTIFGISDKAELENSTGATITAL